MAFKIFVLIKLPQELTLSSLIEPKTINFFVVQPSCLEFYLFSSPLSSTYNPYYKLDSFLKKTSEKQGLRQNIVKHHRGIKTLSSIYDGVVDEVFSQKTPSWTFEKDVNTLLHGYKMDWELFLLYYWPVMIYRLWTVVTSNGVSCGCSIAIIIYIHVSL